MYKKIITLLIVLIVSVCCVGLISADNNTTGDLTAEDNLTDEISEDLSNFIIPVQITDNGIKFSDGFTGFCIDSAKSSITADDHFTSHPTKNEEIENHIKLAIIESYKAGKEDNLGDIVSQVLNGNKEYDVVKAVFNSTESIKDTAVVDIDNTTEATFTFELLKSEDNSKSDCLAYNVSFKTIQKDDVLAASGEDTNQSTDNVENITAENNASAGNTAANDTDNKTTGTANASDDKKSNDGETIVNETNKTVINKTTTTIINETNTTIINKNTTKIINKTNETPKNATIQDNIMKTVGNPIFLLIIVIVIIAIVAVVIRRKD